MKHLKVLLAIALVLNGCVSTNSKKHSRQMSQIESHQIEPAASFVKNDKLYIKYDFEGDSVYFAADLSENTQMGIEKVSLLNIKPVNPEKAQIAPPTQDIIYVEEGLDLLLKKVILAQVPQKKNTAILIMIQEYEAALYKDADGKPQITTLDKMPKDIEVIGGMDAKTFNDLVLQEFKKELKKANVDKTKFLFKITSLPLQPYFYFDTQNNYSATIQIPDYYELKKQMSDLGFSLAFIYSFFIRSHFFAIINAPFTSGYRLFSLAKNSLYSGMSPLLVNLTDIPPLNTTAPFMDLKEFNKYLNIYISNQVYKADVGLLIDGDEFFSHFMLNASRAKESIFIRLYIFAADAYSIKIADMLKQKSNEGVEVRVLLDELNTLLNFKKEPELAVAKDFVIQDIPNYLEKKSKVAARTRPNTWGTFDHSKVIMIDRELAYTGGMNFGEEYRYLWHDMMISLRGPVVGRLVKNFYEAWSFAGLGGDFAAAYRIIFSKSERAVNAEKPGMIDVRLLYTKPDEPQIFKAQIEAIKRANRRIYIENAYFSDDRIVEALIKARGRGVDVRVILPSKNDITIMHKSNIAMANILYKNGIKVYFYRGMSHVKAALYDNWAVVGSANFDKMSLFVNKEMSIAIDDENFVKELEERLFEKDFANSEKMEQEIEMDFNFHIIGAITSQL